jgi:hypothetical protein
MKISEFYTKEKSSVVPWRQQQGATLYDDSVV